jgi:ABC-type multidrug transport system fused ATPase/permease subunit
MINREQVVAELATKTGINFSKYETKELLEKLENTLQSVPKAKMTVLLPILVIIVLNFLWFLSITSKNIPAILLFMFLFTVALIIGGGIGLHIALKNLLQETTETFDITITTTQNIYGDLAKIAQENTGAKLQIPSAGDLLKGVALGIVFPALTKFAIDKAGFIAKALVWAIEKTFMQILLLVMKNIEDLASSRIDKMKFGKANEKIDKLNEKIAVVSDVLQERLQKIENMVAILGQSREKVNKYSEMGQKLVAVPILSVVGVYSVFSFFVIIILIWLM